MWVLTFLTRTRTFLHQPFQADVSSKAKKRSSKNRACKEPPTLKPTPKPAGDRELRSQAQPADKQTQYKKLIDWKDDDDGICVKVKWTFGGADNVWYDATEYPPAEVAKAKKASLVRAKKEALQVAKKKADKKKSVAAKKRKEVENATKKQIAAKRRKLDAAAADTAAAAAKANAEATKVAAAVGSPERNGSILPGVVGTPSGELRAQLRDSQEKARSLQRQNANLLKREQHGGEGSRPPELSLGSELTVAAAADRRHSQMMAMMQGTHTQSMEHGRMAHSQSLEQQRLALQAQQVAADRVAAANAASTQLLLAFLGSKQ
jgi:hypothetical protein